MKRSLDVLTPDVASLVIGVGGLGHMAVAYLRELTGGPSLIRRGPYRFIRHPMYSAALLLIWASIAGHLSLLTIGIGVVVTAVAVARVSAEERLLRAQYPDYPGYAQTTKALIPFVF